MFMIKKQRVPCARVISQGMIPKAEIQKIMKLSEYVEDILLIKTQFSYAAHFQSKGV